jgi:hypothetical protein
MTEQPSKEELQKVCEWECSQSGHSITTATTMASIEPLKFFCTNCERSWKPCTHGDKPSPLSAFKTSTGKNSFWTGHSDQQPIDGQCGGCGLVGKVSVHKLCALCGWWSRREQWQKNDFHPVATLTITDPWADGKQPEGYEPIPDLPGVYRTLPEPSLWQRIKRWWTERGDW